MSAHCHLCMEQVTYRTASATGPTKCAVESEVECADGDKLLTIS
jgi:hypothetical protein